MLLNRFFHILEVILDSCPQGDPAPAVGACFRHIAGRSELVLVTTSGERVYDVSQAPASTAGAPVRITLSDGGDRARQVG